MMRKLLVFSMLILAVGVQEALGQRFDFGLTLNGGFPQGNFRNNVETNGIGVDALFGYSLPRSPLSIGVDLGFINYGSVSRSEPFNQNIPEVQVRVKTTNNIFTSHLFARLGSKKGTFRPYSDLLIGLKYLFTESRVTDDHQDEPIASTTNFDDVAFSYGAGTGLKINLGSHFDEENEKLYRFYLDFRVQYLMGSRAEYLREGGLRSDNGTLILTPSRSRTDLLTMGIGFVVSF